MKLLAKSLAMLPICAAMASPIDSDTLVYVSFDGVQGTAAATSVNINQVTTGPTAQLVNIASSPAATYDVAAAVRIGDGMSDSEPQTDLSSLHMVTNGVFSGKVNGGDGGTALKISGTDFFSDDFTFEFFFKTDEQIVPATQFGRPNLMFCQTGTPYFQLSFDTNAKLLVVYYNVFSGTSTYASQPVGDAHEYDDCEWHHVAIVHDRDSKTLKVFVDWEEKLSQTSVLIDTTVVGDMYFGGSANKGIRFLNGWVDELRFTKRALDESEFLVRWPEASNVVTDDTVVYLPLDGQDGSAVSGNANLNVVPGSPRAEIVISGDSDAAVWSAADVPATFVRDGTSGGFETNSSYAVFSTNAANNGAAVRIATSDFFNGESFTAEMFFKTSGRIDSSATYAMPCLIYSGATPNLQVTFNKADGKLYLAFSNNGTWTGSSFGGAHAYDDGEWHHLAVVYDSEANTIKVFVDSSTPVYERSSVVIGPYSDIDLVVGARGLSNSYTRFFDGAIDAFRFSRSALGPDEFLRRYNGPRGLMLIFK